MDVHWDELEARATKLLNRDGVSSETAQQRWAQLTEVLSHNVPAGAGVSTGLALALGGRAGRLLVPPLLLGPVLYGASGMGETPEALKARAAALRAEHRKLAKDPSRSADAARVAARLRRVEAALAVERPKGK